MQAKTCRISESERHVVFNQTYLTREKAVDLLIQSEKPGTWLLRQSSEQGCYTLSYLTTSHRVMHYRYAYLKDKSGNKNWHKIPNRRIKSLGDDEVPIGELLTKIRENQHAHDNIQFALKQQLLPKNFPSELNDTVFLATKQEAETLLAHQASNTGWLLRDINCPGKLMVSFKDKIDPKYFQHVKVSYAVNRYGDQAREIDKMIRQLTRQKTPYNPQYLAFNQDMMLLPDNEQQAVPGMVLNINSLFPDSYDHSDSSEEESPLRSRSSWIPNSSSSETIPEDPPYAAWPTDIEFSLSNADPSMTLKIPFIFKFSKETAEETLWATKQAGSWLVRESSRAHCLSLSMLTADNQIRHYRYGFVEEEGYRHWKALTDEGYEKIVEHLDDSGISNPEAVQQLLNIFRTTPYPTYTTKFQIDNLLHPVNGSSHPSVYSASAREAETLVKLQGARQGWLIRDDRSAGKLIVSYRDIFEDRIRHANFYFSPENRTRLFSEMSRHEQGIRIDHLLNQFARKSRAVGHERLCQDEGYFLKPETYEDATEYSEFSTYITASTGLSKTDDYAERYEDDWTSDDKTSTYVYLPKQVRNKPTVYHSNWHFFGGSDDEKPEHPQSSKRPE